MIMFDPVEYMQALHSKLKATKDKYKFTTVSGVGALEGILQNTRRERHFFAVDDSQDGETFRGAGAGFFERRLYTVFILGKCDYGDMAARSAVLAEAKTIYRDILSKMIKDKLQIPVIDLQRIRFFEVPPAFATGSAGLYFTFFVENPVNLVYDGTAWE